MREQIAGLEARPGSRANEYWVCCPFCQDEKFRLGINVKKDLGHCFHCEWKSRAALGEIRAVTGGSAEVEEEEEDEKEERKEQGSEEWGYTRFRKEHLRGDELERRAVQYVLKRRLDWKQIREKRIGYTVSGLYAYRVILPVVDTEEKWVGIIGRDFTGKGSPKYRNSPGLRVPYNVPSRGRGQGRIVLAEGPFDALALERALRGTGWDCSALLGHELPEEKRKALKGYNEVVLWSDADQVGLDGFLRIAETLTEEGRKVSLVVSTGGKDAADLLEDEIRTQFETKQRWSVWLARKLRARMAFR